jgi:predicted Zn-dependent peptidase
MGADVVKIGERHLLAFRFEVVNDRFAPKKIHALEKSMGFLWRMLSQPILVRGALHPAWVAQEKENLKRLIEGMINDRMSYAYERCIQEMCKGEPYSLYEYGKLDEVDPITPRDLTQLHRKMLAEAPIDLFVVGDVDPENVSELARKTFRFSRRSVRVPPPAVIREPANGLREHVEKLEVEQGKIVLGCRTGITWGHAETFPLVLYNGLLGAFPHSKLFVNVREKEGLAYATHSSLDYTKGLLFVTAGIDPAKYARCVEVIRRQMDDLAAGTISDDEWDKTRLTITDRVRSREDSPSGKIGAFLEMNLNGHPMTSEQIIAGVEKVTRADVARVAARVRPDTLFFLTRP